MVELGGHGGVEMDSVMISVALIAGGLLFFVLCLGGVVLFLWCLRHKHSHQLGWPDSCTAEHAQKSKKAIDTGGGLG